MNTSTQTGVEVIRAMFAQAHPRAAFLPYFPIGYPDYPTSLDIITAMAEVGVDGFEIGIPFSEPLADGPVIQAATQVALENGITVRKCIEAVRELRTRGVSQPMLLMSCFNPLLAYGLKAFVRDAGNAGANGLIVPDLPPDEGSELMQLCNHAGLALVFFLSPNSTAERIAFVAKQATGFIYLVSVTGVTGIRTQLPPDLTEFVERVRAQTDQPLVLGFGISRPEHAQMLNGLVDGFIVGTAMVKAGASGVISAQALAQELRTALGE